MRAPDRRTEAAIRALQTRQGRRKSEFCLCEGLRASRELLAKAPALVAAGVLRDDIEPFAGTEDFFRAPTAWFDTFAPTMQSQGVLVLARRPAPIPDTLPAQDRFILALDQVSDPGNLGTILRTAAATGRKEVWLTKGSADPYSDKAIRAGIAIQFSLNLRFFDDLQTMVERAPALGIDGPVFLTSPHDGENVFGVSDLFERSIIVLGGEANGITSVPSGSRWVTLPMPGGEESLNVAQAATVFLFEDVRRSCRIEKN